MAKLFLDVFNLSITAGWLIAAVLLIRLIIRKRAPKWISCLLWGMVGLRLVLPFSFESAFSLVPSRETVIPESVYGEVVRPVTPPDDIPDTPVITPEVSENDIPDMPVINTYPEEYIHSGIGIIDNKVNPIIQSTASVTENGKETNILQSVTEIASIVWVCGMAVLAVYAMINYLLLKKRISFSVPEGKDIRKSEAVGSPFILGIFRPRIYLPFGLSEETEAHVIAHERAHLKRKDHLIKPLGYAVLTLHWFNPLVWAAYILLCRDIEYACDEKVVKHMSADARKAYAEALLECGVSRSMISACPVAFGEIGVKKRVKNALNYKKPLLLVMILAVVICAAVAVLFLTSPAVKADEETSTDVSEDVSAEMSETNESEISEDEISSPTPETSETAHTHNSGNVWNGNLTTHWQVCECGEKHNIGAHTFTQWEKIDELTQQRYCTVCEMYEYDNIDIDYSDREDVTLGIVADNEWYTQQQLDELFIPQGILALQHQQKYHEGRKIDDYYGFESHFEDAIFYQNTELSRKYSKMFMGTETAALGHLLEYYDISFDEYIGFYKGNEYARIMGLGQYRNNMRTPIPLYASLYQMFDKEAWSREDFWNHDNFKTYAELTNPDEIQDYYTSLADRDGYTKYYYIIDRILIEHVGVDAFNAWLDSVEDKDQNIVEFIEYFEITREVYDSLCKQHNVTPYNPDYLFGTPEMQDEYFKVHPLNLDHLHRAI